MEHNEEEKVTRTEGAKKSGPRRRLLIVGMGVLIFILLIIGVSLGVVSCQLDSLVESGIEEQGFRILGTKVDSEGVDISLWSGVGKVQTISVRNPEEYVSTAENFFVISEAQFVPELWSLLDSTGPTRVQEIVIRGAEINCVARGFETNLGHFRSQLEGADPERERGNRRIAIQRIALKNTKVHLYFQGPFAMTKRTVEIPDIELRNLGGEHGASAEDLTKQLYRSVAAEVWSRAELTPGPWKQLRNAMQEQIEKIRKNGGAGLLEAGQQILDALRNQAGAFQPQEIEADSGTIPDGG